MKFGKKLISLALSVAVICSALCAMPFTARAEDYTWACALHDASTADARYRTAIWNSYSSQTSSTVGSPNYNNNQSYDEVVNSGVLAKTASPYIAYMVNAPAEGDYKIKPVYEVGSSSNGEYDRYNMVIGVNDKDYYTCKDIVYNGSTQWVDSETLTVHLNAGVNVIRMLSSLKRPSNVWVNINCLYVESTCTVMQCFGNELTLNAVDSSYINRWPICGSNLGNVSTGNGTMRSEGIKYDNMCLTNFAKVPYFSYTVNAPAKGYYDIDLKYNIGGLTYANNAFGYFVVRVGGRYYKCMIKNTQDNYNTANISVPLEAGTNVVSVTTVMEVNSDYYVQNQGGYPNWCDITTMTFHGGVTKSATQINPQSIADEALPATVMDGETYGIINRYSVSSTENGIKSGKHIIGGMSTSKTNMQSLSSMMNDGYLDKSQIPYVSYLVNASAKGTYTLDVVYKPQLNSGYSLSDYYMVISVNDSKYYKAYYKAYPGNSNWSDSTVSIELDKGVNTIRCMSVVAETYDMVSWLNQDCIMVKGNYDVSAVKPNLTHLQSADSNYINGFTKGGTSATAQPWHIRQLNDYRGKSISGAAGLTYDNLTSRNMKYLCYFSYTVDVPADGYYDMSTYISTGSKGATGYIITVIDGEKQKHPVVDCNDSLINNRSNISTYLTKGTHTIAISGIFDHSAYMATYDGYTDWCNMGALSISGGMTKSATQIDPLTIVSESENDTHGLILGSAYYISKTGIVTGVSAGTSVFMFKNNFKNPSNITVKSGNTVLSDDDCVMAGATVEYTDEYYFTVGDIDYDVNGDGKLDVRDMKLVKEYAFGDVAEINTYIADVAGDSSITSDDADVFRNNITRVSTDTFFRPITMGANVLMDYANPVGRLVVKDQAVFMESSASNFTVSGYMKGNVVANLSVNKIKDDELGIFVEIDGDLINPQYFKLSAGVDLTKTLASNLPAGYHTIKVSKSTDAKNDDIYVTGVTFSGKPTVSVPAEHRIEVIGDSITAGYASTRVRKTTSYFTYANYAADALHADYYSVANGGWRFGSDGTCLTNIYPNISMQENLGAYDFSFNPEVIVINVGTNDGSNPSATDQLNMLRTVRAKNPNATIIWAYGMIDHNALTPIKNTVESFARSDKNTYFLTLTQYNDGADSWHTGPAGHKDAGDKLSKFIAEIKGWTLYNDVSKSPSYREFS